MDKIYGIFSGVYSDWEVHGFMTDEEEAEKYCALKNQNSSRYDQYYVMKIDKMDVNLPKVNLKCYYHMTVRFNNPNDFEIDEPSKDYYLGKDKGKYSNYNVFSDGSGWIAFYFNCTDDKKAFKIAKDKYMEVLEKYSECNNFSMAAKATGAKHI